MIFKCSFWLAGVEVRILQENWVTTMAVDALAPQVTWGWNKPDFDCWHIGGTCEHIEDWTKCQFFADKILQFIFLDENYCILIEILLKFVPMSPHGLTLNRRQAITWTKTNVDH